MLFPLLQTSTPPVEAFSADSLAAKGAQLVETLKTTPKDELLEGTLSSVASFGLKVLLAVAIYIVGAWLIRKVKKVLAKTFEKRKSDKTIATFIQSLVSATLWVVLILAMVGTLGINTTSIAALLAAGGMAIGMAMSGTVQNFAGGLILLAFKPFKVGDFIDAQSIFGRVSEISIVHTKIVTTDNREITIPNGELANGNIDNYSSRDPHRLSLKFNVPYGTDVDQVREILLELVKDQPKILNADTPGAKNPKVYVGELQDSSVQIKLRVWLLAKDYKKVQHWLNERIYKELPKHGIHFPFPQLDVHMRSDA
ncbi:MAG: mechanosensitive ion channel family protein [Bacteroidales bacterium]|nr:mechanosensitive ion channel family protein [Bacteroidales bacterium]